jgi:hypothetical protein
MAIKYKSRIPEVDYDNPQSWARDDITGLPVMHPDMIKQMEYGPQGLYWTGFMVHFKDADEPNPQLVPPRLKPDPVPILNQRYFYRPQLPAVPSNFAVTAITETTVTVTWSLVLASGNTPSATSYTIIATNFYDSSVYFLFENIVAPPFTLTGLAGGNSYDIQIASVSENIGASAFSYPPLLVTTS